MTTETVTPATVMREYFKTGNKFGRYSKIFNLADFANEYSDYVRNGHIPERNGKHRQVLSWPEEVRQHKARTALKKARLQGRAA
jgi:hypothetical protein